MKSHAKAEEEELIFYLDIANRKSNKKPWDTHKYIAYICLSINQEKFRLPCMHLPKHDSRIHGFLRKDNIGSGCGCRKLDSVPADHWQFGPRHEDPVMLDIHPFQVSGRHSWHPNHFPNDPYKGSVKDKTKTQHQLLRSLSNDDDDDVTRRAKMQ